MNIKNENADINIKVTNMFKKTLNLFGIYPKKLFKSLSEIPKYIKDIVKFKRKNNEITNGINIERLYPCLNDRKKSAGTLGQYFKQDLHVAKKIYVSKPEKHVDVGSRIDGFILCLASFRKVEVFDIRELKIDEKNVNFNRVDVMSEKGIPKNYCDSLSCLHTVEHFGLGRYGDKILPDGHLIGLNNIKKTLKKGGKLYLSVPIGQTRVEFNAHRVFSVEYVMDHMTDGMSVEELSIIDDDGVLRTNVEPKNAKCEFGDSYGCGIFEMKKK